MIKSFKCKDTKKLFDDTYVRRFKSFERQARKKLEMLNAAQVIEDLKSPPGNKLEPLKGDRLGQYSIRINKQFRLCFSWEKSHAFDVEIVDYH